MTPGTTKIIDVIVAPDGSTKIETKGFSGSECRRASRALEEALGAGKSEELTAEFYGRAEQSQHVQQPG
ncbi:MAG: DUF2997 domain-containing protein [Pirellulales bacterium]